MYTPTKFRIGHPVKVMFCDGVNLRKGSKPGMRGEVCYVSEGCGKHGEDIVHVRFGDDHPRREDSFYNTQLELL